MKIRLNSGNILYSVIHFNKFDTLNYIFKKFLIMNNFYITLLSSDSLNYFPSNTLSAFTNQFNKPYVLSQDWQVGICNMFHNSFENTEKNELLYIYTDIIQPNQVGFSQIRCLRIINSIHGGDNAIEFKRIHYMPIEKNQFENISILLTNGKGDKIPFNDSTEPSMIKLHFIKKNV